MSDYVKERVIRYPIEKDLLDRYNCKDAYDLERKLIEIDADFGSFNKDKNKFAIFGTDSAEYIDYILDYSYGECAGDFGFSRLLSEKQKEKYKPMFEKFIPELDTSKFRDVIFCYYNGCDCPDYYEVEEEK